MDRQAGETFRWDSEKAAAEGEAARKAYAAGLEMPAAEAQELISQAATVGGSPEDHGKFLAAAGVVGVDDVARRSGKGQGSRTLGEILEAQCDHYSYLRNRALR
eukprot:675098-Pyramimonas_sp.AAC.1